MCNIGELRIPASAMMRLHASKPTSSPNQKPVFGLSVMQQQQPGTCWGGVAAGRTNTENPNIVFNHCPNKRSRNLPCGNWIRSCAPTQRRLEPAGDSHFASLLIWGNFQGEEARCDGVPLIRLVSSAEPLSCLLMFRFQNVPHLPRGPFDEPGGKSLKGAWAAGHARGSLLSPTGLQSSQPSCWCCWGLASFTSWDQRVFLSKQIKRKG